MIFSKVVMIKKASIIGILILLSFSGLSQNEQIDSLQLRLKIKLVSVDKINTLHKLVWELAFYNPQESIQPAKLSLMLSQKLNDSTLIARSFNRIGLVHDYAGNYKLAEKNYLKAYSIKLACDGKSETDGLLNNLGSIYYYMGEFEKSMDHYLRSLKIREQKKDANNPKSIKIIAQSYNNLGLLLKSQKNYQGALKYYSEALKIKEGLNDFSGIIITSSNLGVVYMELDSLSMAENQFNKAVLLSDSIKDYVSKAMLYNNIGLLYKRNNRLALAKENYQKSIDLYEQIRHQHEKSTVLINLSSIYFKEGNLGKAELMANEALALGKQSNAPDVTTNALKLLSQINEKINPAKSLVYLNQYIILKDSINNTNVTNKINQLAVMYETEKKETEIDLLKKEQLITQSENERKDIIITRNKIYLIALIIGIIFILFLSYFIIQFLRSRKHFIEEQSQKMHEKQQREIDNLRNTLERQGGLPAVKKVKIDQDELNKYLLNPLSKRELDVLYLIASGSTNISIGERLFISVNTVKTHILNIYEKLDVKNRTAAASKANHLQIIQEK